MAQDEYYYEIQLTNKQLVFYFLAGALGLILSFLLGIMVGKGVDNQNRDVRQVREEPPVTLPNEEPSPAPVAAPSESLDYARRLESQNADATLEKTPPAAPLQPAAGAPNVRATPGAARPAAPTPKPAPVATATPRPVATPTPRPRPAPTPTPSRAASGPILTIQVGAYRDKSAADTVKSRLKAKGYAAYVVSPAETSGGLFNVRVGSYSSRADAEKVKAKLEGQEKFKPFIVKQ